MVYALNVIYTGRVQTLIIFEHLKMRQTMSVIGFMVNYELVNLISN